MKKKAPNIQKIKKLSQFITKYPNKDLQEQLQILQSVCPNYRPIKGDGNCFYRALAFLYLVSYGQENLSKQCKSIASESSQQCGSLRQNIQLLRKYQLNRLQVLKGLEKQQFLVKLFNQSQGLDNIIISCFRLMTYSYLTVHKGQFVNFFQSQAKFHQYIQKVKTNYHQSEGIEIFAITQALKVKLTLFCVGNQGFHPIYYQDQIQAQSIYLFFRPGHYDIVYPTTELFQAFQKTNISRSHLKQKKYFRRWLFGDFQKGPMYEFWYEALSVLIAGVSVQLLWGA